MRKFVFFVFIIFLASSIAYGQKEPSPCPNLPLKPGELRDLGSGRYGYKPDPSQLPDTKAFQRGYDSFRGGSSGGKTACSAPVRLRGVGGFGYGQTIIDIIANWETFSLAAQKQYCYSWFGADSFENKYGYRPTWQRILNFGYITDKQLRDYLRQKLDILLSDENSHTKSDKKLRETYINCLNALQTKKL